MMTRVRNRYFFVTDLLLLPVAVYLSYVLRLDDLDPRDFTTGFIVFAVLAAIVTPLVFQRAGLYARYWRYASIQELQLLIVAATISALLTTGGSLLILSRLPGDPILPRSIPFIFLLLSVPVTALPRLLVRLWSDQSRPREAHPRRLAAIMGAGDAGVLIARELRHNPQLGVEVAGFLDDDPGKRGMRIHGLPVLGNRHQIPQVVQAYQIDQVIIAIPTAPGKTIREIVEVCEATGVETKIIPGIYELLDGSVSVSQLRDVELEDLLRREPVQTDTVAVGELLRGKRVLVTGGGGSIGSELCRQVLRWEPAELIVVGHGENSVFAIHNQLTAPRHPEGGPQEPDQARDGRGCATGTPVTPVIADVRFADRIKAVFEAHRPEIVFHAAAHKHVALMEANPGEAITNNVLGTQNLLEAAVATGVERFVMISTDKAVNPTSLMGASKRAAELLVHRAARQTGRAYVAVRFGNVLGSRGSVVPLFKEQIAAGGPVTVTHPEVVRYFMTIPEAVQLVLQAAALGRGGEVFVLDMGEPIKIADMARDLIELSGLEVGKDIDIVFTGLKPGEKLFEELFVPGESYRRTEHQKILIADNASRFIPLRLDEAIGALREAARDDDRDAIIRRLQDLVPEYRPAGELTAELASRAESG